MSKIHNTAIIGKNVKIGKDVEIGPYCIIDGNVEIGNNNIFYNNVVIHTQQNSYIKIGNNNTFFSFCIIGTQPQDNKFKEEVSNVEIGDDNIIREFVTINGGSDIGNAIAKTKNITKISNNCYLYISSHIAHDVFLENNVVITNNTGIAGHCKIDHDTIIGGLTAIHQFVHVGCNVMIGMSCAISTNIPPYSIVSAEKNTISGANIIGLKRAGFVHTDIVQISNFYKNILNKTTSFQDVLTKHQNTKNKYVQNIINFFQSKDGRSYF